MTEFISLVTAFTAHSIELAALVTVAYFILPCKQLDILSPEDSLIHCQL
jgi:hypothetical protein